MNKTRLILEHLKNNEGITSIQAFELYGATRLSAVIFNLRKYGYIIQNDWKTGKDRYGNSCRFVQYKLIGKVNEKH